MRKQLLLYLVLFIISVATAHAAGTATLSYELDTQGTSNTVIVKDVPFYTYLKMSVTADNPNNNVRDLLLHTQGAGFIAGEPVFIQGLRGDWLPRAGNPDQNKLLSDNVWQYMFTAAHGTVDTTKNVPKVVVKLQLRATSPGDIKLDETKSNSVGGNIESFTIGQVTPQNVDPQPSKCGDGVVGYFDGNTPDKKDGDDKIEVCDVPNADGTQKTGCHDCQYIEIGYTQVYNPFGDCSFGSRTCNVIAMDPRGLLLAKVQALIIGDCYPYCQHPGALYAQCRDGSAKENCRSDQRIAVTSQTSTDLRGKIKLVALLAQALSEYFSSPGILSS